MKSPTKLIAAAAAALLAIAVSAVLTGCGGGAAAGNASQYAPSPAAVQSGVTLLSYKTLGNAKSLAAFETQKARAEAVSKALTALTTTGLSVTDVVAALAPQFTRDPDAQLYIELVVSLLPPTFSTFTVQNAYLTAAATGLARGIAMAQPPAV